MDMDMEHDISTAGDAIAHQYWALDPGSHDRSWHDRRRDVLLSWLRSSCSHSRQSRSRPLHYVG
jgi:hypothetical protein